MARILWAFVNRALWTLALCTCSSCGYAAGQELLGPAAMLPLALWGPLPLAFRSKFAQQASRAHFPMSSQHVCVWAPGPISMCCVSQRLVGGQRADPGSASLTRARWVAPRWKEAHRTPPCSLSCRWGGVTWGYMENLPERPQIWTRWLRKGCFSLTSTQPTPCAHPVSKAGAPWGQLFMGQGWWANPWALGRQAPTVQVAQGLEPIGVLR